METKRQERISKLLLQDMSEIIQMEMRHITRRAMVTVTKVHVTPDLSMAKVYLSLFATPDKDALLENIKRHSSEIRGKLGNRIRHQLRVVPELHFFMDDSLDYIDNIDQLLK